MPRSKIKLVAIILSLVLGGAWSWPANQKSAANKRTSKQSGVDRGRIINANKEPGNWMTHGRTYDEQRFSPLKQINDGNVAQLGLAWYFDMDTDRGQESTPIVVDGVMYFTSAWSKVFAVNAETGAPLWSYDPKVPPEWGASACCDVVNRGVAIWQRRVFVGTLDGRLVALDAATGKPAWETLTVDRQFRYTITGAPRIVDGKVIIGNGGAEFGVRGYVSAYDSQTGKMLWRFYTVPGDPSKPFESPALERAAKTWTGEWWKSGGGGTVWDSIVYDSELDLIYLGVGNGSPWNRRIRSPGGGDNLYLSSIVAIKAKTGEYVWHYQETPGEMWDYTATQQIILADIPIDGQTRKVILHAPKNGFFYVLDRATGALISAKPYTFVTWAAGIDMKTGRPIETVNARYPSAEGVPLAPGPLGAHNWQPMSFSPLTGLVYIPVQDMGFIYKSDADYRFRMLGFNTGVDMGSAELPQDPNIRKLILDTVKGRLVAWDPVKQKQVWNVNRPGPWNGGVLSTAGNLVFEGTASGSFEAYRADTGEKLWSFAAQTGVMAGPVSYTVNGEQYVAVAAGWGGAYPLVTGELAFKSGRVRNISRLLVFKLGGKATLPALPESASLALNPPAATADEATLTRGKGLFHRYCAPCHGAVAVGGGVLPDLRYSKTLANDKWFDVVLGGSRKHDGMVSFANELSRKDAADILAYVIARANQEKSESKPQK